MSDLNKIKIIQNLSKIYFSLFAINYVAGKPAEKSSESKEDTTSEKTETSSEKTESSSDNKDTNSGKSSGANTTGIGKILPLNQRQ